VLQLIDIIDKLHTEGFSHNDIKPDNILVIPSEKDLSVKLVLIDLAEMETLDHESTKSPGTI
jgi:serine/threonine protein kinase